MERRPACVDSSIWIDALAGIDPVLADEVRSWIVDGWPLIAPDLIHYEVVHVLTKHMRNGVVTAPHAVEVLNALLTVNIELIDDDELHSRALDYSLGTAGLSGYDAQFIAVCERSGAELWTMDKSLAAISQRLGLPTRLWTSTSA